MILNSSTKLDFDLLAREYAAHRETHPEVLKGLVELGKLKSVSRVLDVGCGTGNYLAALEEGVGCQCWGIEPSEQMLAIARIKSPNSILRQGQAEQLDFSADFFDLVFSVDVIHHVVDRPAYFRAAYRALKDGGVICTVTDSGEIIRNRMPLSFYFPETVEVELNRYPSVPVLNKMMRAAGFSALRETLAEESYELTDIQKYRDKAFSSLHLISDVAFNKGLHRMEEDLHFRPILCQSMYLLLWGQKSRKKIIGLLNVSRKHNYR